MKKDIHPVYQNCTVYCVCGSGYQFTTRSTKPEMKVEVCSRCHSFFTGEQKYVDTAGRIERFKQKYSKAPEKN
jgi:large subunit ribosomal protein L31